MAADKPQPQEDNAPETPAWIVSFTDMITLLLAFFVLLQAFADEQDPELFRQGQGAFRRSIAGLGVPDLLFGKPDLISGETKKKRHPTKESDEKKKTRRVIDNKDAEIRQAFQRLRKAIDTRISDTREKATKIDTTPIVFAPGQASLNARAKEYLRQYADRLGRNANPTRVVIVASAPDRPAGRDRWMLSTRRARAVSEFMGGVLSRVSSGRWTLMPMGCGAERTPDPRRSAPARQEFVRIAIMGAK